MSSTALDALREFYSDRDARLKAFEDLKAAAEDEAGAAETANRAPLTMEAFAENWNDSQFWVSCYCTSAKLPKLANVFRLVVF